MTLDTKIIELTVEFPYKTEVLQVDPTKETPAQLITRFAEEHVMVNLQEYYLQTKATPKRVLQNLIPFSKQEVPSGTTLTVIQLNQKELEKMEKQRQKEMEVESKRLEKERKERERKERELEKKRQKEQEKMRKSGALPIPISSPMKKEDLQSRMSLPPSPTAPMVETQSLNTPAPPSPTATGTPTPQRKGSLLGLIRKSSFSANDSPKNKKTNTAPPIVNPNSFSNGKKPLISPERQKSSPLRGLFSPSSRRKAPRTSWDPHTEEVPLIFRDSIDVLRSQNVLEREGVFRITGNLQKVFETKRTYSALRDTKSKKYIKARDDLLKSDVHVIAGVLKLALRELSQPLFTTELLPVLKLVSKMDDYEVQKCCLVHVLSQLPQGSAAIVNLLFPLLNDIHQHADKTKMTSDNLATIFGPAMLIPETKDSPNVSMDHLDEIQITKVPIKILVEEWPFFSSKPDVRLPDTPEVSIFLKELSKAANTLEVCPRLPELLSSRRETESNYSDDDETSSMMSVQDYDELECLMEFFHMERRELVDPSAVPKTEFDLSLLCNSRRNSTNPTPRRLTREGMSPVLARRASQIKTMISPSSLNNSLNNSLSNSLNSSIPHTISTSATSPKNRPEIPSLNLPVPNINPSPPHSPRRYSALEVFSLLVSLYVQQDTEMIANILQNVPPIDREIIETSIENQAKQRMLRDSRN